MAGEGRGCDDAGTSPVEFAYDAFGCCVLSLTREALEEVRVTGRGQASAHEFDRLVAFCRECQNTRTTNVLLSRSDSRPMYVL